MSPQPVLRLMIGGWAAVRTRTALLVVPGSDPEGIADEQPAGVRSPGRPKHKGAGQIAAPRRHRKASRSQPEAARRPIQDRSEDAAAVGTGQAEPLYPAGGRAEGGHLAVGQE